MDDVWSVEGKDVVYLLEEIEDIGEGETLSGNCLFVILFSQLGQLLKGFALGFVQFELYRLLEFFYGNFTDLKGDLLLWGSFFLFCESYYHNL